ncbi:hypothetical protein AB1N83_002162 [Pleurotus pulmonarius]
MATTDSGVSLPDQQSNLEGLPNSLASLTLQNDGGQSDNPDEKPKPDSPPRPLKIYTPQQLLFLYESPLVQVPNGMPDLKDWFGTENEQNMNKKESETILPVSNARRHRRDPEDDTTARPSFRSALTQPSQMGNFKHQSLRAPDRDRDTRDFRDKEGHEHLRNLSDKYDRDRLGTNARNKDRDAAPHLTAGTSRLVGQTAGSTTTRRTEGREGARRRGDGDDWRRGGDRNPRDDRSDTTRRDRDDRERPRSRVRDTSRPRRDASTGRRDRDKARDRDDRPLDRRDRDDYRRDYDRDSEHDDPRRWRDDGKREERLARRAGDRERPRERPIREYDSYRPTYDDAPGKKPRDRKLNGDDKDRDDRREREKEKEPAWMDTYIPSPSNGGIMGGNADEMDGIQAWKKDMKEKQEKEKSALQAAAEDAPAPSLPPAPSVNGTGSASNGLDEIQMFRMLMKKEDEKKKQVEAPDMADANAGSPNPPPPANDLEKPVIKPSPIISVTNNDGPNTLLTMLTQTTTTSQSIAVLESSMPPPPGLSDQSKPPTSRLFPVPQAITTKSPEPATLPSHQPNPHPGSRLLAFGASSNAAPKPHSPMSPSSLDPPMVPNPHSGFSPFEEGAAGGNPLLQGSEGFAGYAQMGQAMRRVSGERAPPTPSENGLHMEPPLPNDSANVALASSKGSRFAKFFDGNKNRDPVNARTQPSSGSPIGPSGGIRHEDHLVSNNGVNVNDNRAMAEIFNMLSNSAQGRSLNGIHQPPSALNGGHNSYGQPAQHTHSPLQMLGQQHPHQQQQPLMHGNPRLDSLYDSRLDDRSFVPDGMVPGLRNAPLPRGHDNGGMFPDTMDELHFARQQRMPLQQRVPDQMFPGQVPIFSQQPGRNAGIPIQQQPFRGGPSPISLQNQLQSQLPNHGQRLPPGLANLGGRPPHEPNQFMGNNMQNSALLSALQGNHLGQPTFNNLPNSNNLGYGPPMRGPPGHSPIQPNLPHSNVGLGHPNSMDMRMPSQAQLMGLAGGNVRGFNPQQGPGQLPLLGMRQQPPILPPHMAQGGIPAHLQQQPNNPQNHDLMALLMGGPHRE